MGEISIHRGYDNGPRKLNPGSFASFLDWIHKKKAEVRRAPDRARMIHSFIHSFIRIERFYGHTVCAKKRPFRRTLSRSMQRLDCHA